MFRKRRYSLFKGVSRLTEKYPKRIIQIKGLFSEWFFTEEEMLCNLIELVEPDTYFSIVYDGTNWNTLEEVSPSFSFRLESNDLIHDGTADEELIRSKYKEKKEYYTKQRE